MKGKQRSFCSRNLQQYICIRWEFNKFAQSLFFDIWVRQQIIGLVRKSILMDNYPRQPSSPTASCFVGRCRKLEWIWVSRSVYSHPVRFCALVREVTTNGLSLKFYLVFRYFRLNATTFGRLPAVGLAKTRKTFVRKHRHEIIPQSGWYLVNVWSARTKLPLWTVPSTLLAAAQENTMNDSLPGACTYRRFIQTNVGWKHPTVWGTDELDFRQKFQIEFLPCKTDNNMAMLIKKICLQFTSNMD